MGGRGGLGAPVGTGAPLWIPFRAGPFEPKGQKFGDTFCSDPWLGDVITLLGSLCTSHAHGRWHHNFSLQSSSYMESNALSEP